MGNQIRANSESPELADTMPPEAKRTKADKLHWGEPEDEQPFDSPSLEDTTFNHADPRNR